MKPPDPTPPRERTADQRDDTRTRHDAGARDDAGAGHDARVRDDSRDDARTRDDDARSRHDDARDDVRARRDDARDDPRERPADAAGSGTVRARVGRAATAVRRRGRLVAGLSVVAAFYFVALFADFIAPYDPRAQSRRETRAPASVVRFRDAAGRLHLRPFVYARSLTDPLARTYGEDTSRRYPLALFTRGDTHRLLGLFQTDLHLFGLSAQTSDGTDGRPASPADESDARNPARRDGEDSARQVSRQTPDDSDQQVSRRTPAGGDARGSSAVGDAPRLNLLGTDHLGRDRFSRLLHAARFSLAVGPAGTLLASLLGVLVGCVSGYAGRKVDAVLMRAADAMMALPALVLILAARAAFPDELPPARAAALLVALFVALGWAEMARLARGLVLSLRQREFVVAARSLGATESRILFRHVLPNAARPLLVQSSLMLPAFLLAETALSYLGVGVQEPAASWGSLLTAASSLTELRDSPFLLLSPAFAIFLFVLGVRLAGDGLRGDGLRGD
jgi:ABC-type dipeptide/oligopeptide/nickel transport system permease subunit